MITVLIETCNDEEALARTLGSLVPAAVEGVVREVIVVDRGSTDHTAVVAEHAGCSFIAHADLAGGLRRARGEWILLLEPGARLAEGWIEDVVHHTTRVTNPARFSRSQSMGARFLSRFLAARRPLADGFLVSKPQALSRIKPGGDVETLVRGLPSKRLDARIMPSEQPAR